MDDSLIIIGWTDIHRFRLYDTTFQTFKPVSPTFGVRRKKGLPYINGISDTTIEEIFINRDNYNWKGEVNDWCNLINKALPNSLIIHWTWSDDIKRQSITEETGGEQWATYTVTLQYRVEVGNAQTFFRNFGGDSCLEL